VRGQLGPASLDQLASFRGVVAVDGIAIEIQNLLHFEHPTPMRMSNLDQSAIARRPTSKKPNGSLVVAISTPTFGIQANKRRPFAIGHEGVRERR